MARSKRSIPRQLVRITYQFKGRGGWSSAYYRTSSGFPLDDRRSDRSSSFSRSCLAQGVSTQSPACFGFFFFFLFIGSSNANKSIVVLLRLVIIVPLVGVVGSRGVGSI